MVEWFFTFLDWDTTLNELIWSIIDSIIVSVNWLTGIYVENCGYSEDKVHQSKQSYDEDDVTHIDPEETWNTITEQVCPNANVNNCSQKRNE